MGRLECVTFQLPERKERDGSEKTDLVEEVVMFDGGRKLSRWGAGVEGSCVDMVDISRNTLSLTSVVLVLV